MPGHHTNHVHFQSPNEPYIPPHVPTYPKFSAAPAMKYTPPLITHSPPNHLPPFIPSPAAYSSSHLLNEQRQRGYTISHRYLDLHGISWDMRDHPSSITRSHHTLSALSLEESAASPPYPFMLITCIYLPWSIEVRPSNRIFVTLKDVVDKIYDSLRTNITQHEFALITSPHDQHRARRAYEARYSRLYGTSFYEHEKDSGMKQIDFLMGHTRFLSLNHSSQHPEEWHLMVE